VRELHGEDVDDSPEAVPSTTVCRDLDDARERRRERQRTSRTVGAAQDERSPPPRRRHPERPCSLIVDKYVADTARKQSDIAASERQQQ
jgi:hypothetical protein